MREIAMIVAMLAGDPAGTVSVPEYGYTRQYYPAAKPAAQDSAAMQARAAYLKNERDNLQMRIAQEISKRAKIRAGTYKPPSCHPTRQSQYR